MHIAFCFRCLSLLYIFPFCSWYVFIFVLRFLTYSICHNLLSDILLVFIKIWWNTRTAIRRSSKWLVFSSHRGECMTQTRNNNDEVNEKETNKKKSNMKNIVPNKRVARIETNTNCATKAWQWVNCALELWHFFFHHIQFFS